MVTDAQRAEADDHDGATADVLRKTRKDSKRPRRQQQSRMR